MKKKSNTVIGDTYTAEEFAANVSLFGDNIKSEMVIATFRFNKIESATLEEAKQLIEAFMKREVK